MSSAVFRQIAQGGGAGKAERLFRAAITAFCSLTRPSRNEIAQLDDLTLPLFDSVPLEARRFAAAALSECEAVPAGLLRRLCDQRIDVAAPLLIRSASLRDIDLVSLIGRHGLAHARAIARRRNLNPAISNLVNALLSHADAAEPPARRLHKTAEECVRERLRGMMRPFPAITEPQRLTTWDGEAGTYEKLRSTALTGVPALFHTALADVLTVDVAQASRIADGFSYGTLLTMLKAFDLTGEQAFVVTAAIFPKAFGHAEAIRLFLERFENLDSAAANDSLRRWKENALAITVEANNANRRRESAPVRA